MTGRTPGGDNTTIWMNAGQQISIRVTSRTVSIHCHKVAVIWHMQDPIIIVTVKTGHVTTASDDISHCLIRGCHVIFAGHRRGGEMTG